MRSRKPKFYFNSYKLKKSDDNRIAGRSNRQQAGEEQEEHIEDTESQLCLIL